MAYHVIVEKSVTKFLNKISKENRSRLWAEINLLHRYPIPRNKTHILDSSGYSMLCELGVDKYRVYYTIENQFVVIENIRKEGTVTVFDAKGNHKSGSKNFPNQQKYIKRIVDWFKKTF